MLGEAQHHGDFVLCGCDLPFYIIQPLLGLLFQPLLHEGKLGDALPVLDGDFHNAEPDPGVWEQRGDRETGGSLVPLYIDSVI